MSNIEASPVPVKIGDHEFLMKPLTNKNSGEINNFIKMNILSLASDFCTSARDQRIVDATMSAAMEKASNVDWMTQPERMDKIENLLHIFWISVRDSVGDMSKDKFCSLVMSKDTPENLNRLMEALTLVNPILRSKSKEE
jgi:hypothetical protein